MNSESDTKTTKREGTNVPPSQLLPFTTLKERRKYFEPDGKSRFLLQIRYDCRGAGTQYKKLGNGPSEPKLENTL